MTEFVPLGDCVVVRREAAESVSKGGIIFPESAKNAPSKAIVVAIGPGRVLDSGARHPIAGINVGDRVVFGGYGGTEISIDGDTLNVLDAESILGVLK